MSKEFFQSVYTYYAATPHNAFYTATGGRLEYDRANPSWTDNFATMQGSGSDEAYCFRQPADDVSVQFNVFSTDRSTCFDLLQYCRNLYDLKIISVTNHYDTQMIKTFETWPVWNEPDNLWQASIEFTARVQRQ